jgi:uncharacterized protein (DUF3084 family)
VVKTTAVIKLKLTKMLELVDNTEGKAKEPVFSVFVLRQHVDYPSIVSYLSSSDTSYPGTSRRRTTIHLVY